MSDRQYSLKRTWRGLVVLVRHKVPGVSPGFFHWGRWRRAGQDELAELMRRLSGEPPCR